MKTLLIVDAQNDFMKGGSLEVKEANKIIPVINELLNKFDLIIFTKDWHPADHKSFASQHKNGKLFETIKLNGLDQSLTPDHCIQYNDGSKLHEDIDLSKIKGDFYFFKKGLDKKVDSYSGFYDSGKKHFTGLSKFLKERDVHQVFITGLALDFCVKHTMIDSINEGFETILILDGTKGTTKEGSEEAKKEFLEIGGKIIESWELQSF